MQLPPTVYTHTIDQTADLSRAFFFVQFGCKAITHESLTPCCPSSGLKKVETGGRFKSRHLSLLVLHSYLNRLHILFQYRKHGFVYIRIKCTLRRLNRYTTSIIKHCVRHARARACVRACVRVCVCVCSDGPADMYCGLVDPLF